MRADVQNMFIGIHMLYNARERDLTVTDMQTELENYGYRIGEREVKQELERLTQDNFLTAHGEEYSITGTGIEEYKEILAKLDLLHSEVMKPVKTADTAG
ncbi:hypothetical protein SAMN04487895_11167 [Paenibacillus sophorae]|uniref:YjcQ protein n=1 Tax=Paenibacillus sophorae TaxID=1333845 RepID=A0A1H8S8L2_9BACL|nr:hypothetical protein [Paenibacillus sophorae]QWU16816.1 hypothetical protein KP014_06295 [Paenibacillus sophorae]SEO75389.1 hypothetical protein SAMN04487895_11167 [Paenibacillus sophorae]